ncbi:hypothetical protein Pint_12005 [Pistacia integerrima]|uniref:Uncharacterized protein n=1 Tax=Pistacia integerrima TaxID=434235 RepID=A0ACC0XLC9_9ROSI|nr:hypothetical protein Pint_12005 [Pistacia integerrima]
MASSSSQPIMASSSLQPIMASSSSQRLWHPVRYSRLWPLVHHSLWKISQSTRHCINLYLKATWIRYNNSIVLEHGDFYNVIYLCRGITKQSQRMDDRTKYMLLHKSILEGNLESVRRLCDSDDHALEARITVNCDTTLHIAVRMGRQHSPFKRCNFGNVQAAEKIMRKEPDSNEVANNGGWIPLIEAARHAHKEMITYLLQFSESYLQSVRNSEDKAGVFFLNWLIIAGFYGEFNFFMDTLKGYLALDLVYRHSSFATTELDGGESLLRTLAGQPSAFPSGDAEYHNALQIAVMNRQEKVFNLLKKMSCSKQLFMVQDNSRNNILHLPGKLAPQYQLNRIRGAALQMQRELQWLQVL